MFEFCFAGVQKKPVKLFPLDFLCMITHIALRRFNSVAEFPRAMEQGKNVLRGGNRVEEVKFRSLPPTTIFSAKN